MTHHSCTGTKRQTLLNVGRSRRRPWRRPWRRPYPDAVADFQQDVALGRILLVHEASSNEDSCTTWKMNKNYSQQCGDHVISQLPYQTFSKQVWWRCGRCFSFFLFFSSSQRKSDLHSNLTPPTQSPRLPIIQTWPVFTVSAQPCRNPMKFSSEPSPGLSKPCA